MEGIGDKHLAFAAFVLGIAVYTFLSTRGVSTSFAEGVVWVALGGFVGVLRGQQQPTVLAPKATEQNVTVKE